MTEQNMSDLQKIEHTPENELSFSKNRVRSGISLALVGYVVFLLGARPGIFGLDNSWVIGFIQIAVFLFGLAIICIGSYLTLISFWPKGKTTLLADFGSRVMSTGYVICLFAALADVFGFGSNQLPNVFFGLYQAWGVEIGMAVIAIGMMMLVRFDHHPKNKKLS